MTDGGQLEGRWWTVIGLIGAPTAGGHGLRVLKTKDLSCVRLVSGCTSSDERNRSSKPLVCLVGEIAWEGG